MIKFLLGRLMQGILVLSTLYTITFFLAKAMPGEPFTSEKNVSAETKANIRKLYGPTLMGAILRLSKEHYHRRLLGHFHKQRKTGQGHHCPILSQLPYSRTLRIGFRGRNWDSNRRSFRSSKKQLG